MVLLGWYCHAAALLVVTTPCSPACVRPELNVLQQHVAAPGVQMAVTKLSCPARPCIAQIGPRLPLAEHLFDCFKSGVHMLSFTCSLQVEVEAVTWLGFVYRTMGTTRPDPALLSRLQW